MLTAATASAQYITEAPAGGFDVTKGKDYVVIYTPQAQVDQMGSRILSNQNLDPEMKKNQFYYWTCDWAADQFTLYNIPNNDANSWGDATAKDNKINMTPLWWWGGGNFTAKTQKYDLSAITNNHVLHIGFCDIGDTPSKPNFQIGPNKDNGFSIKAGIAVGSEMGDYVGVGTFGAEKGKWYYIDIPVADLVSASGDYGFTYNFSSPLDIAFTVNFGSVEDEVTCSTYTYGDVDPDTGMKAVTISKVGNALAIDHVFFYVPDNSGTGISNATIAADQQQNSGRFNLQGQRVGNDYKGVVIENGKKMVIK